MGMDIDAFVSKMPKCELHIHIEGALTPSLVHTLAARNSVPVPKSIANTNNDISGFAFHDLTTFLAVYYPAMTVLLTEQDFFDLAYTYLQKCKEQNVIHTEMFFDPQAHTSRGVPFPVFMKGFRRAIEEAQVELGVSAELIMCFLRDMSADSASSTLDEGLQWRDWIVGVGLDSDERGNPPIKFKDVFARARAAGLNLTMHCDIDQPDSIEHIRQVLEDIQVDRVDHGTNIVEDERLVQLALSKGIALTCCPMSNAVVTSDFKGREMTQLLRQGLLVTINSDDPAYFRGYMSENMLKMGEETDLSRQELVQLQRNAFTASWVSSPKKQQFLKLLDAFEKDMV